MPGIIGIFSEKEIIQIESLLDRMANSVIHENWYKTDEYTTSNLGLGRIHLGKFNPEKQPIFNEDKSLCIFMDGKIYDYEKEKEILKQKGHKFIINNDPEFCLHLFEEEGENFSKNLNCIYKNLIKIQDVKIYASYYSSSRHGNEVGICYK